MTKTLPFCDQSLEEDYIDIDPSSPFTSINVPSRRDSREFEFKLCANPQERCSFDSPADELFYKGVLLPLHLYPRIQAIQRVLLHERNSRLSDQEEQKFQEESISTCYHASARNEYVTLPGQCGTKNRWSKKLKGVSTLSLCSKLKASHTYLKSLFAKPTVSNDQCRASRPKDNIIGKNVNSLVNNIQREKLMEEDEWVHRKSFSNATKLGSSTRSDSLYSNSSSSSSSSNSSFSSLNSNAFYITLTQSPVLRRSSSVNSEMERSIKGAITYCKKSQDQVSGRKSVSDIGLYSF
ncbi:membrane-associated kinase regulator [Rhynchospora pubera]|uniref:Membrane-associated kinase regulator n=1 Tax=Rhynchospora pubera TaxID=906938 RepID=A0AAV8FN46_9POAL|nr:membrane-associated kinase regulator [Rhynchospora pubera]